MHCTELTNATTPTSWFLKLYVHCQNETDSHLLSRLQIAFLLDSSASILVFHLPTYLMITQILNVCNRNYHDVSKTLAITNQCGVSVKQFFSVICFSSIGTE